MAQLNDLLVTGASRLLNGLGILGSTNADSIFPNVTDTYALGSSDKRWNTLYAKTSNIDTQTVGTLTVTNYATIGANQSATGTGTGALRVSGGISATQNSWFGGNITTTKNISATGSGSFGGTLSAATTVNINGDWETDFGLYLQEGSSNGQYGAYFLYGVNDTLKIGTMNNNDKVTAITIGRGSSNVSIAGTVTAPTFSGALSGNATTATALTSNAGSTGQPVYFTGGKPAAIDWHIGNSGVGEHNCNNITYNMIGYYNANGPSGLGEKSTDGAIYTQAYNSSWVGQIAQDYRNGNLFIRGKNNGTWQSWKAILTSDYRPMVFHWSGQSGQPTWLWGGENGVDMYVYNPSNFVVAGASYLKDKTNGTATYLNYGSSGMSSASWYGAWDGYTLRAISPADLANHLASTTLNSIYLKYNGWWDSGNNSLNVNNASGMIFAYSNHGLPGSWGVVTTLEYQYNAAYKHQIYGDGWNNIMYFRTASSDRGGFNAWKRLWAQGDAVTGAVWNDYAECRESDIQEPGYVLIEKGDDTLTKSTERMQPFAGVSSDTWGFSQGETERAKTHIAVAGRVLVYPYRPRDEYKPGDCVCAAPNGTVDIMTPNEVALHPDRIVGTVSCVPNYETWGGGELADRDPVQVNGRIWIKVR